MRALLAAAFPILVASTVRANPTDAPVHAGPQPTPLVLPERIEERGNVRGCPVGETCVRPSYTSAS